MFNVKTSDLKTLVVKTSRRFLQPLPPHPDAPRQRRLMVIALTVLLVGLALVLYWNRNFWFPNSSEDEVESQPDAVQPSGPVQSSSQAQHPSSSFAPRKSHDSKAPSIDRPTADLAANTAATNAPASDTTDSTPPISVTATRTVLPPLEIEVVAGDEHRALPSTSNPVRVDLQTGTPPPTSVDPPASPADTAAGSTAQAAERVEIAASAPPVVSRSVRPDYPLLARQMKVEGAVTLQALISRDGQIQELHVLSGPPILAHAAQEAVRQRHFKPHYVGAEAVETQARIKVNFTISTN